VSRSARSEALVVAALLLLPFLFWWRLWTPDPADRATVPEGDFTGQYYPLQLFAARELAAGRLPAWNPYLNAGQPGLADPQTGTLYPLNLLANGLLALLGLSFSPAALHAQVILHFSLASLFTYLFARRLARRAGATLPAARFAGAVAALSFTYAGYLTSFPVQQLTILETAVWLPLVLFFLDLSAAQARAGASLWPIPRAAVLAGVALACALLAGHPQTALYVVYAVLAYGLFLAFNPGGQASGATARLRRAAVRMAHYVLLPLALGCALAAAQLIPTLAFILRSTRAGLDYQAVAWGFPLAEFTHLLYPGYFGGSPQYVGILPLILAAASLFVRRARREVVFWIVFAVLAFLLAFGGNLFLYNVAYLLAPGFAAVRNQERIIYLCSFAVGILAGYGALVLVQPLPRSQRRGFRRFVHGLAWSFVALLLLSALWYYGFLQSLQQDVRINLFEGVLRHQALILLILGGAVLLFVLRRTGQVRRRWLMSLALGLIWLNLFTVNWQYNLAEPTAGGPYPQTGLVRFLHSQPGTFRISSAGLLPGGASAGIVYELEDITANTPLRLEAFQQFEDRVESWRRWQLLNVQYVLSDQDLGGPGLEQVYEGRDAKVYRLADPLPRAWVVHRVATASGDQAFDLLNADDFDPRLTALLPSADGPQLSSAGAPAEPAQVLTSAPGRLILRVAPATDGLLVVSQPYDPGWQARVDGARVPITQVDAVLQGLPVAAGAHQVELTYHLSPWPAAVSVLALFACVLALLLRRRAG
jgi:hypothetical protein